MEFKLFSLLTIFVVCWNCVTSSHDSDINELNLNFNQIKRLIANFNNDNLVKAANFAVESTERSKSYESRVALKSKVRNGSISHAQLIESLPDDDTKSIDIVAEEIVKASSYLLNKFCKTADISNWECAKFMSKYSLPVSGLGSRCSEMKPVYKTYRRMLPASYKDGLQKIRTSVSGRELPLPRTISRTLFSTGLESLKQLNGNKPREASSEGILDNKLSLSVAQWAQFMEHDLSKTVTRSMTSGNPIECCDQKSVPIQPRYFHEYCLPLRIPSDDPHYRPFRVTCLNYVRSALGINSCKFGSINQLNQASNKLDLSQLYGNNEEDQEKLRSFHEGLLLTSRDGNSMLPKASEEICLNNSENATCYSASDSRVNANPLITSLYTVFLRSHNNIAKKLKKMNRNWDDNRLFAVAKGINIAIYQKIVYNDWANVVLGKRMALEIRSKTVDHDKSDKVSNEFGTVAIKFYNTMLAGDLMSQQEDPTRIFNDNVIEAVGVGNQRKRELLKLQDAFYKPKDLHKNSFLDQIMNTALRQNAMAMDSSYVDDLSLQLFRSTMYGNQMFGGDSLAFDILRSRDHGLQPYINYIKKCLNIRITQWDDLRNIVKEDDLNKLRTIYESVQDVDLIVGGLSEAPNDDATVGPTFSCILSDQLISSRVSDENFYKRKIMDADGEKIALSVEKYSAARFICDNTKLRKVQRNIFQVPSEENPLVDCSDYEQLPKLDLSYWLLIQPEP